MIHQGDTGLLVLLVILVAGFESYGLPSGYLVMGKGFF